MWELQEITSQQQSSKCLLQSLYVVCTFNNTFMYTKIEDSLYKYGVYHIDINGKTLFKKIYSSYLIFRKIEKISDKEVAFIYQPVENKHKYAVDIINLETYAITSIPVNNIPYEYNGNSLVCFGQDKYAAVISKTDISEDQQGIIITVFNLHQIKKGKKGPIVQLKSIVRSCSISSLISSSKIFVSSGLLKNRLYFTYFTLKNNPKGELRTVRVNKLSQNEPSNAFSRVWQVRPDFYCALVYGPIGPQTYSGFCSDGGIYTIDASKGETGAVMRKINCPCAIDPDQVALSSYGNSFFVIQKYPKQGKAEQLYINWVRNQGGQVIGKKTISIAKGQKLLIRDSMVILIDETDKNSTEIKFLIPKITLEFSIAEVGMSFLLHFNEDFDDDLLQDAIELLQ